MKRIYLVLTIALALFLSGCGCDNCVHPTSNPAGSFVTVTYRGCDGNTHVVPEFLDSEGRIITADCSEIIDWEPCIALC